MILLAGFQPLSIAEINIFHQQPMFYREKYHEISWRRQFP